MKVIPTFLLLLPALATFAQRPAERTPAGGGEYHIEKTACLTPDEYLSIQAQLTASVAQLRAEGRLPEVNDRNIVAFSWPLQAAAGLTFNSYYSINKYVDQNTGAGVQDYNCGARSYDGHNGIDIDTWPFAWYMVANNSVEVIAAAAGTIISKTDGNADDHCGCLGNWNAVYVQHADGSIAWYGHMKNGSLTPKAVGQTVIQGEYLGVVASSGCSTNPHLHFEVYKATPYQRSNLIEPFQGACNLLNAQSWWAAQQNYRVSTLNLMATHNAPPQLGCPTANEATNFSNTFAAGAVIYLGTYYRDQLINQVTSYRILRPDNSVSQAWTHTSPNTYNSSWWYFTSTLPTAGPNGIWTYEITYQGVTSTRQFTVTGALPVEMTRFQASKNGPDAVLLTWETITERNNNFFDVERSDDGHTFISIGQVKGGGTSSAARSYQFLDKAPLPGTNYYRLRQVDHDDQTDYSDIVQVQMTAHRFVISPNPTTGPVALTGPLEDVEKIRLFNSLGKLVRLVTGPSVQSSVDLSGLPAGVYFIEITHSAGMEKSKVWKQ